MFLEFVALVEKNWFEMGILTINNAACNVEFAPVKYGALYNWWATQGGAGNSVTSSDDWDVALINDWKALCLFVDPDLTSYVNGNTGGLELKESGVLYWVDAFGVNNHGMSLRGSGQRNTDGTFTVLRSSGNIWTANGNAFGGNSVGVYSANNYINCAGLSEGNKAIGFGIRLVYNGVGVPESYTGNNGKVYEVVTIGGKTWLKHNLNETKLRDGSWIPGYDGGAYTPISGAAWAAKTTLAMCYYGDDESNG